MVKILLALALSVPACAGAPGTLRALFIGNSFTGRHNLADLVKQMAEAGNPGLRFETATVIYGGRTLRDHWRLGTQNFVRLASLTAGEENATIAALEAMSRQDPKDTHARAALARHRQLAASLAGPRGKWDIVVLQSYRDDLEGGKSLYAEYAPKFAELAKAQGARVILYETTPATQHERPLAAPPDRAPVLKKAAAIAALAARTGASAVPMSMVALRSQTVRPDLTLRFVNDAHLNQTMAYLTACTFFGVLFGRSPEGLPVDRVTDIRFFKDTERDKDRDGGPITKIFSPEDRAALQRIAWEGLQEFQALRQSH